MARGSSAVSGSVYGELEYRGTLMKNGLLGMVAFLNATTISNLAQDERLFDSVAIGGGARGFACLINKRSKTNFCFDVGGREKTGLGGDAWRFRKPFDLHRDPTAALLLLSRCC